MPREKHRFSRADRIRTTREFQAAIRGGEKVSWKGLSLYVRRHSGPERRLGLAIASRSAGAVARNRIKRRLREYVRVHRGRLIEGLDLVVVVHRDLSRTDPETFRGMVRDLFARAGLFQHLSPQDAEKISHSAG